MLKSNCKGFFDYVSMDGGEL